MFSSKCCCLAPLNNSVMVEDEDNDGLERREVAREEVEVEEDDDEWDEPEVIEAAAATAAALLSCRREWEIKARSTLGARGRVEGVDPPEAPREKPVLVLPTSKWSPHVSSSCLLFGFFCIIFMPLELLPLLMLCPISDPPVAPNAIPNKEGGRSESESSGFCSRWRRKCTLRLPRVVKRLRHTGHW